MDNKAFCKGVGCRPDNRKFTSILSGKKMCTLCAVDIGNNEFVTIDEFLTSDDKRVLKVYKMITNSKLITDLKKVKKNVPIPTNDR